MPVLVEPSAIGEELLSWRESEIERCVGVWLAKDGVQFLVVKPATIITSLVSMGSDGSLQTLNLDALFLFEPQGVMVGITAVLVVVVLVQARILWGGFGFIPPQMVFTSGMPKLSFGNGGESKAS